jgi:hypothetical protein
LSELCVSQRPSQEGISFFLPEDPLHLLYPFFLRVSTLHSSTLSFFTSALHWHIFQSKGVILKFDCCACSPCFQTLFVLTGFMRPWLSPYSFTCLGTPLILLIDGLWKAYTSGKEKTWQETQITHCSHSHALLMGVIVIISQHLWFRTPCVTFNDLNGIIEFWALRENKFPLPDK